MSQPARYSAFAKLYLTTEADAQTPDRPAVFGNGLAALLRGIQQEGSLNRAAKDMHMAYSKAWTLINHAEERFGHPLIQRNGPRGSELTDEGQLMLQLFDAVNADINAYARRRVAEELARLRSE